MHRAEKIGLALVFTAFVAYLLYCRACRVQPVKTLTDAEVGDLIVGDSATEVGGDGPAYMGANWAWPQPLAMWNPPSSVRMQ